MRYLWIHNGKNNLIEHKLKIVTLCSVAPTLHGQLVVYRAAQLTILLPDYQQVAPHLL